MAQASREDINALFTRLNFELNGTLSPSPTAQKWSIAEAKNELVKIGGRSDWAEGYALDHGGRMPTDRYGFPVEIVNGKYVTMQDCRTEVSPTELR